MKKAMLTLLFIVLFVNGQDGILEKMEYELKHIEVQRQKLLPEKDKYAFELEDLRFRYKLTKAHLDYVKVTFNSQELLREVRRVIEENQDSFIPFTPTISLEEIWNDIVKEQSSI